MAHWCGDERRAPSNLWGSVTFWSESDCGSIQPLLHHSRHNATRRTCMTDDFLLPTGGCPIKYAFRKGVHFFRERHIFLCFYRTAQCTSFLNMYTLMPLPKTCVPFPKTLVFACLWERHIKKCMPFSKNIHSSQRHNCTPFPKTYFIGQPPGLLCLLTIHQTFFMRVWVSESWRPFEDDGWWANLLSFIYLCKITPRTGYYTPLHAMGNTGGACTLQQQRSLQVKYVLRNRIHWSQLLLACVKRAKTNCD